MGFYGEHCPVVAMHRLLFVCTMYELHICYNRLHATAIIDVLLGAGLDLYSLHTSADYVIRYLDKVASDLSPLTAISSAAH